jgi:hypothetical protein
LRFLHGRVPRALRRNHARENDLWELDGNPTDMIVAMPALSYDDCMEASYRAVVELGCQCGERLKLPIEAIRTAFECSGCDHRHLLSSDQVNAIEEALGRALVLAHRGKKTGSNPLPVFSHLRH